MEHSKTKSGVKIDLYTGLLGTGKTSLIKSMLSHVYHGYRTAVIENEIGKVNLDVHEFSGVAIREITSGCVCCTLQGNLKDALQSLTQTMDLDYIVIEATGLADVKALTVAIQSVEGIQLNRSIMVVNARKTPILLKVAGDFFYQQLSYAKDIYLNFADQISPEKLQETKSLLQKINPSANLVQCPFYTLTAETFHEYEYCCEIQDSAPDILIQVRDIEQPEKLLPRHMRKKDSAARTLYTHTLHFTRPLTETEYLRLEACLKKPENKIWRAKGYISVENPKQKTKTIKIDYCFGDFYQQESEEYPDNVLVLIMESQSTDFYQFLYI